MAHRQNGTGSETRKRYKQESQGPSNNMFGELNYQADQSFNQINGQSEEDEEFHDSRVVKTVRSLKRQNSAIRSHIYEPGINLQASDQRGSGSFIDQQQTAANSNQFILPVLPSERRVVDGLSGTAPFNGFVNHGITPSSLNSKNVSASHQAYQMNYNGIPTNIHNGNGNSGLGIRHTLSFSKQGSVQDPQGGEKLTAYQRRQLEKQQAENGQGGALSIEDRLARLKQIHQKPTRPPSGVRKVSQKQQVPRGQTVQANRIPQPLDPVEFQKQIEQRTQDEKQKLEEFKKLEAKMKEYQRGKKGTIQGQRPPLAQSNANALTKDSSHADLQIQLPGGGAGVLGSKTVKPKTQVKQSHKANVIRKNSNMGMNGSQQSQSTNTNTHDRQSHNEGPLNSPDSDNDATTEPVVIQRAAFCLENETGQRGAQPESNKILETEQQLLHLKKDKCLEIFRNCTEIREAIVSHELNPQGLEMNQLFQTLFQNRHFLNMLGDLLSKKPATTKIEKFLANQVKAKLREIQLDRNIASSFETLNQKIEERLRRLRNAQFELPDNMEDLNNQNRRA